jgi:hypothetical protein
MDIRRGKCTGPHHDFVVAVFQRSSAKLKEFRFWRQGAIGDGSTPALDALGAVQELVPDREFRWPFAEGIIALYYQWGAQIDKEAHEFWATTGKVPETHFTYFDPFGEQSQKLLK